MLRRPSRGKDGSPHRDAVFFICSISEQQDGRIRNVHINQSRLDDIQLLEQILESPFDRASCFAFENLNWLVTAFTKGADNRPKAWPSA